MRNTLWVIFSKIKPADGKQNLKNRLCSMSCERDKHYVSEKTAPPSGAKSYSFIFS